eukprot:1569470-Prymnesium_polylepis.1
MFIVLDATALVALASSVGALYHWPHLRSAFARLLRWSVLLTILVFVLTASCVWLKNIDSLQTLSPLYAAAAAGDRARVAELLARADTRVDVGARGGLGLFKSETTLATAAARGHT